MIGLFKDKKIDIVTFTSSSTVKNFVEMFEKEDYRALLNGVKIASIGPITEKTASELGIKTDITPKAYTIPALTEAIVKYYGQKANG
jgi:uroporphyrinogen III methyltransferase/synthase